MAYAGYLIKLGGSNGTQLPMKYIGINSYSCTPNQRMENQANRAVSGVLRRTTVAHTASKIEFNTPTITNADVSALNTLLQNNFSNAQERKITIQYYDMETDTYKEADCYMPDVQYSIDHIDNWSNVVYYSPVRYAFIEY